MLIIIGGVVGVVAVAAFVFKLMWRVAEPNQALIISGLREHTPSDAVSESLGFKIVTGKGTFVIPVSRPSAACHSTFGRPNWPSIGSPIRASLSV